MRFIVAAFLIILTAVPVMAAKPLSCDKEAGRGVASWYGPGFEGSLTKNHETFDSNALSAAHPTLPFGTIIKVTNMRNAQSVYVRINDRGAFDKDRIIDLSESAAIKIDMIDSGTTAVALYQCD